MLEQKIIQGVEKSMILIIYMCQPDQSKILIAFINTCGFSTVVNTFIKQRTKFDDFVHFPRSHGNDMYRNKAMESI